MYLRDEKREPIGCIAIKPHRKHGYLEYQVSMVNPVDRTDRLTGKSVPFNRQVAKDLALGRMVRQGLRVPMSEGANMGEITWTVMADLSNMSSPSHLPGSGDIPSRAIKAAKLWLRSHKS